eukprot:jgi/Astpho2/2596/fgenesh1_pg.00048_%23_87_t
MPLLQHLCGYLKGVPQEILEGCGDVEAEGKENATERSIQRNAAVLLLSPVPQTLEQLAAALQTGVEGLTGRGKDVIAQQLQQQLVGCAWGAKDAARLYWVNSGPDMPLWEPPQGKDAYGCKVAILEGNAWVEGEIVGIRKGSELYEVQTSNGESSWRGLQGAGVRWLDEPPPLLAAFSAMLSASFNGGTCISGQTVLGAAQQEGVQQCLKPVLMANGDAAAASTAPAEGPAVPEAGQSLPDIHRQVDAVIAQDELGQLEALERRGLERQQQGKVRRKEQHLAARTRQEQAAAEAARHPRRRTTSRAHSRPSSRAVSSSGMAAPSNGTIAQKCQQLEREVAKLKAYAARQAGTETARPPKPRSVRGDLRKTAGVAKTARVVRTSPDGDEVISSRRPLPPASEAPAQTAARLTVDPSISAAEVMQGATRRCEEILVLAAHTGPATVEDIGQAAGALIKAALGRLMRCRSEDVQQLVGAPPATVAGSSPAGSGESGASLPSAEPQAPAASARQAGRALAATLFRDCNALQQELGIAAIPGSNTVLRNALALQLWLRVHLLAACKGKRDACSGCRQLVLFPFGLLLPRAFADMHGEYGKLPVTMATLRHMCGDYTPPPSPSELRSRAALHGDGTVVEEYSPSSGLQAGSSAALGEGRSQEPSMQREGSVARGSMRALAGSCSNSAASGSMIQPQPQNQDPVSRMARQLATKGSRGLTKAESLRAVQATRQVTYSLKAAGEKGKRSRLAKDGRKKRRQVEATPPKAARDLLLGGAPREDSEDDPDAIPGTAEQKRRLSDASAGGSGMLNPARPSRRSLNMDALVPVGINQQEPRRSLAFFDSESESDGGADVLQEEDAHLQERPGAWMQQASKKSQAGPDRMAKQQHLLVFRPQQLPGARQHDASSLLPLSQSQPTQGRLAHSAAMGAVAAALAAASAEAAVVGGTPAGVQSQAAAGAAAVDAAQSADLPAEAGSEPDALPSDGLPATWAVPLVSPFAQPQAQQLATRAGVQPAAAAPVSAAAEVAPTASAGPAPAAGLHGCEADVVSESDDDVSDAEARWAQPLDGLPLQRSAEKAAQQLLPEVGASMVGDASAGALQPGADPQGLAQQVAMPAYDQAMGLQQGLAAPPLQLRALSQQRPGAAKHQPVGEALSPPPKRSRKRAAPQHMQPGGAVQQEPASEALPDSKSASAKVLGAMQTAGTLAAGFQGPATSGCSQGQQVAVVHAAASSQEVHLEAGQAKQEGQAEEAAQAEEVAAEGCAPSGSSPAAAAGSLTAGVDPGQYRVTRSGAGRGPQQEADLTAAVTTRGRARDAATCKQAAPRMDQGGSQLAPRAGHAALPRANKLREGTQADPGRSQHAPKAGPQAGAEAVISQQAPQCRLPALLPVLAAAQSRTRKRKRAGQQTSAQPDAAPSVPAPGQPGSALEGLTPASPGAEELVELPEGGPAATNRQRTWQQQVTGSQAPGQPACSRDMSVPELRAHSRQQPGCGKDEVPLGPLDAKGCQLPDRRDDEGMPLGQLAALRCQLPGDVPLGQLAAAQQLLTSAEAAKHGTAHCGEQRQHSSDLAGWAQEGGMAMQASHIRFAIAQCQGGAARSVARAAPVPVAAAAEHGQAQGTAAGAAPPASNAAAAAQEHSQLQGALTAAAATQELGQAEGLPAATAPSPDQLPAYNAIAAGHTPAPGKRNRKGKREGREGAARHSEEATPSGELALGDGC